MKKKIAFLMCLIPATLFARESYWKVAEVKPVVQTSLFFEAMIGQITNLDHFVYEDDKKQLWYYDSYSNETMPRSLSDAMIKVNGKASSEGRVEMKVVGSKLKILIYYSNDNIAFIVCEKVADNKPAFLSKVEASKKMIAEQKLAAVKEHAPVTLPATDNAGAIKVGLDGFAISLPADKYFIVQQQPGRYEVLDKSSGELATEFDITKESVNRNDSLVKRDLYPVLKQENLWVNTMPYYDWEKKEKGTSGYVLSNSLPLGGSYVNLVSTEKEDVKSLSPYVAAFRSVTADLSGAIGVDTYNASPGNMPQRKLTVGGLSFTLPASYQVRDFLQWGNNMYTFEITPGLSFTNENPNSHFSPIKDTTDENASPFKIASGGLYSLKNSSLKTGIADVRASYESEGAKILGQDATGLLYSYQSRISLIRYIQRGDTHYVYHLELPDLATAAKEFGRSVNMFQ